MCFNGTSFCVKMAAKRGSKAIAPVFAVATEVKTKVEEEEPGTDKDMVGEG